MAKKIIDLIAKATLALILFKAISHGAPLTKGEIKSRPSARIARDIAFTLIQHTSTTMKDFQKKNFKNGDYKYMHLKGVETVFDYDNISKEEFLKKHIVLLFKFHEMLKAMIQNQFQASHSGDFENKFVEIDHQVEDLYSVLRYLEKSNNLPATVVSHAQYPSPKEDPQATQKEHNEWSLTVMMDLLRALMNLQRGIAEKFGSS